MDELRAWLKLSRLPNFGADTLAPLLGRFESVAAVTSAAAHELEAAKLPASTIDKLVNADAAQIDSDLRWLETSGNAFIAWGSPEYPSLLAQVRGAPIGLFVRGQVAALHEPQLAIVGARNPTALGRETSEEFAAHLANCGLAITSGLAAGIDAAAHRGALRSNGVTVAVCATGLEMVYPSDHRKLAEAVCERGALVSEFPPGIKPLKFHFPRRNRLISGLSLGTLVVEAALQSGSLITAKFAADQGREVFAIPGSIHNPLARGCHQLLRQGAKLVETAEDILAELGPLAATLKPLAARVNAMEGQGFPDGQLDKEYKILLDALGFEPTSVDQLVARTGFKAEAVASMLLILELDGRIAANPGALYSKVRGAVS
jgi:DNA processing protein